VRRLRVQLTVLLALLGMLVVAWGAAIFLGARDAARRAYLVTGDPAALDATGRADERFQALWARQTALEDQLARSQWAYARNQHRTYEAAQILAVRTALGMLAALVLLAVWLRRAVGAPADALHSASGRLAEVALAGLQPEVGAIPTRWSRF
jgi:hypothetical protein